MHIQRWRIGDCTLTSVVEDEVARIPVQAFFPDADPQAITRHDWLVPDYADVTGRIMFRVQAFLLELHGRLLIVDPCVGNAKRRELPSWNDKQTPFLDRLLAAGFATDAIDTVIHTHLHADHVGWDTSPKKVTRLPAGKLYSVCRANCRAGRAVLTASALFMLSMRTRGQSAVHSAYLLSRLQSIFERDALDTLARAD